MKLLHIAKHPYVRLVINFICALGHCLMGLLAHSWWFITVGMYYAVLSTTRFCILQIQRNRTDESAVFATKLTGILLIALSFCIVGVNVLSALEERGKLFHKITMIGIATYTFTKITLALIGMVRTRHSSSPTGKALRNIALADACVSIFSMQRSMLVSFPGMQEGEIRLLNILTGTGVWIVVLLLGINLIGGRYTTMAKSKIADAVCLSYKKVENSVVSGYKKVEHSVVRGYNKIENKFVAAYLTKEGETVEEAKERLKQNNKP